MINLVLGPFHHFHITNPLVMKPGSLISVAVAVTLSALPSYASFWPRVATEDSKTISNSPAPIPKKFGVLAFPRFVGLDAYGPLELFNIAAFNTPNMTLSIVAETMDPVPAHITNPNSGPLTWVYPAHTFDQDPDLDVLLIPGMYNSIFGYD